MNGYVLPRRADNDRRKTSPGRGRRLVFLRLLDQQSTSQNYRAAFIRKYALPPLTEADRRTLDGDSLSFLGVMTGRVPDGRQLYSSLTPARMGDNHSSGSEDCAR